MMAHDKSIIPSARALGAFIHDVRIERSLTQEALATTAGVSRSWLIGVEQGKRQRAELDKILSVLHALDINLILEHQLSEQPSEPRSKPTAGTPAVPSVALNEILKNSIPHFGQASGITQALNQQEQENKTDKTSE